MEIVAVALRDVQTMGVDTFYVRLGPNQVHTYDVYKDGRAVQTTTRAMPDGFVTASVEKFNASYRVIPPVPVTSTAELAQYLGRFKLINDTQCTLAQV